MPHIFLNSQLPYKSVLSILQTRFWIPFNRNVRISLYCICVFDDLVTPTALMRSVIIFDFPYYAVKTFLGTGRRVPAKI